MSYKKVLDVELIKNSSIYCYESAMATAANWFERDYQMIFAKMLKFSYVNNGDSNLCDALICGTELDVLFSSLEMYHGIRPKINKVDGNIIDLIKQKIDLNSPIMIYIIPELCEWTIEEYYRIYFFVIGYDEEGIYGYDLHSDSNTIIFLRNEIVIEDYKVQNQVLSFDVVSEQRDVDFESIKNVIRPICLDSSMYNDMKLFASDLRKCFSYQIKYERVKDFRQMDLLNKFADIVRSRKLFADTCYYVFKNKNDEFANYIGCCFDEAGEKWNRVWRLLAKAFILNKGGNTNERELLVVDQVVEGILDVAVYEKSVIDNIFGECRIENQIIRISNSIDKDEFNTIIDVDLNAIYNNKAFQDVGDIIPNFTEQGEYFLYENIKDSRILSFGKVDFCINERLDNFICANQKVIFPKDKYKKIYIMGCAEWGSGSGLIQICNNDRKYEQLLLEFPDWFFCKMKNTSTWKGKAKDCENNTVDRGLFCLDFELDYSKEISELIFPKISNVHIFGIKLIK